MGRRMTLRSHVEQREFSVVADSRPVIGTSEQSQDVGEPADSVGYVAHVALDQKKKRGASHRALCVWLWSRHSFVRATRVGMWLAPVPNEAGRKG